MNTNKISVPSWLTMTLVGLFVLSLSWFMYMNYKAGMRSWNLAVSAILLAIPLALLYFSVGVLVMAARQRNSQGQIDSKLAKFIYWTPRIAGVVIILFVAMFSLDVFDGSGSIWEMLGAFVMHSLPSIFMGIILAIAWKRDEVGFFAFLIAAIFFLRVLLGNPLENIGSLLLFSGPMAVIAMLFWANWKWKKELHPNKLESPV